MQARETVINHLSSEDSQKLEQEYIHYIEFKRGHTDVPPSPDFCFNKVLFKDLLQTSPACHSTFYNKEITIYLHGDGTAGHASADLGVLQPDRQTIQGAHFIGLNPNPDASPLRKLTGTRGEVIEEQRDRDKVIAAQIKVTEEQYFYLANFMREQIDNPSVYSVYGKFATQDGTFNCATWLDMALKSAGISDGIQNKFSRDELANLNWRPVQVQSHLFFNEHERNKEMVCTYLDDPDAIVKLAQKFEELSQNEKSKHQDITLDNAINSFENKSEKEQNVATLHVAPVEGPSVITPEFTVEGIEPQPTFMGSGDFSPPKPPSATNTRMFSDFNVGVIQPRPGAIQLQVSALHVSSNTRLGIGFETDQQTIEELWGRLFSHLRHLKGKETIYGQEYTWRIESTGLKGCQAVVKNTTTGKKVVQPFTLICYTFSDEENRKPIQKALNKAFEKIVNSDVTKAVEILIDNYHDCFIDGGIDIEKARSKLLLLSKYKDIPMVNQFINDENARLDLHQNYLDLKECLLQDEFQEKSEALISGSLQIAARMNNPDVKKDAYNKISNMQMLLAEKKLYNQSFTNINFDTAIDCLQQSKADYLKNMAEIGSEPDQDKLDLFEKQYARFMQIKFEFSFALHGININQFLALVEKLLSLRGVKNRDIPTWQDSLHKVLSTSISVLKSLQHVAPQLLPAIYEYLKHKYKPEDVAFIKKVLLEKWQGPQFAENIIKLIFSTIEIPTFFWKRNEDLPSIMGIRQIAQFSLMTSPYIRSARTAIGAISFASGVANGTNEPLTVYSQLSSLAETAGYYFFWLIERAYMYFTGGFVPESSLYRSFKNEFFQLLATAFATYQAYQNTSPDKFLQKIYMQYICLWRLTHAFADVIAGHDMHAEFTHNLELLIKKELYEDALLKLDEFKIQDTEDALFVSIYKKRIFFLKAYKNNQFDEILEMFNKDNYFFESLSAQEIAYLIVVLYEKRQINSLQLIVGNFNFVNEEKEKEKEKESDRERENIFELDKITESIKWLISKEINISGYLLKAIITEPRNAMLLVMGVKHAQSVTVLDNRQLIDLLLASGVHAVSVAMALVRANYFYSCPIISTQPKSKSLLRELIHYANTSNCPNIISACLKAKLVNAEDLSIELMPAVKNSQVEIVRVLLEAGVDPNCVSNILSHTNGAIGRKKTCEMIQLLLKHGAHDNSKATYTLLHKNPESRYRALKTAHLVHLSELLYSHPDASKKEKLLHILQWYYRQLPMFRMFNNYQDNLLCQLISKVKSAEENELLFVVKEFEKFDRELAKFMRESILDVENPIQVLTEKEVRRVAI